MDDEVRWPEDVSGLLWDGLSLTEVVEALGLHGRLRVTNRIPPDAPTFMAVCAPTRNLRLVVVACTRAEPHGPWTIARARDARLGEFKIWREHTQ